MPTLNVSPNGALRRRGSSLSSMPGRYFESMSIANYLSGALTLPPSNGFQKQNTLLPKLLRWTLLISHYRFTVESVSGRDIDVAYTLSRYSVTITAINPFVHNHTSISSPAIFSFESTITSVGTAALSGKTFTDGQLQDAFW